MMLKINDIDNENIMYNLHELKENLLYMIGFRRVVREGVDKVME